MDPRLQKLLEQEEHKQLHTINLIASENYTSASVRAPLSSSLSNKYAEGLPDERLYPGLQFINEIEKLAMERLKQLFKLDDSWIVNVQPLSGAPANLELLTALFPLGSKIMMLSHEHGGHMSHGDDGSLIARIFQVRQYRLNAETALLDYDQIEKDVAEYRPACLIAGYSCYPRDVDYQRLSQICHRFGAHLHVDIAHVAGFIAAGLMSSPFAHADSVSSTTHKTLRGPRGGVLFTKVQVYSGVFPGVQAGAHCASIAALAQAAYEAQQPQFVEYMTRTLEMARAAAEYFQKRGYVVQTGGTDCHMILVNFPHGSEEKLANAGIYVNECHMVDGTPGVRIGFQVMSSLGLRVQDARTVCEIVDGVVRGTCDEARARQLVASVCSKFVPQ